MSDGDLRTRAASRWRRNVDSRYQRTSADQCVRYLIGVCDLNNHIVVSPRVRREVVKVA